MRVKNLLLALLPILTTLNFSACSRKAVINSQTPAYTPIASVQSGVGNYKSPQLRTGQDPTKAIGIAISGGGSTSQYFSLGVMMGLDEINNGGNSFLKEVDYFSTVSGGGFGVGYYLILLKNDIVAPSSTLLDYWKLGTRKTNLQEFMHIHTRKMVEIPFKWCRFEKNKIRPKKGKKARDYPYIVDRELLQAGKSNPRDSSIIQSATLYDFFVPNASPDSVKLPMFVINGTIYNNTERLPFMPHIIDNLQITGSLLNPVSNFTGNNFPLCQAIAASSAFPGVLPIAKFSVSGTPNKVIRVLDGGAVDNLGFTTLFELLSADANAPIDKRALIIDCMVNEKEPQRQDNKPIEHLSLLERAALLSLDANLLNAGNNIKKLAQDYTLNMSNIKRVGFHSIKEHLLTLNGLDVVQNQYRARIANATTHKKKLALYRKFLATLNLTNTNDADDALIGLNSTNFAQFTTEQVFLLYELATHVTLKIAIYPWEKDILVLAGRYAAYLKQTEIRQLLQ